jgi:hypothetical protein
VSLFIWSISFESIYCFDRWLIQSCIANEWISNTLDFEMKETRIRPGPLFTNEFFFLEEYKGEVPSKYELEHLVSIVLIFFVVVCVFVIERYEYYCV